MCWRVRGVPRYADLMISSIGEISREHVFKSPLGHIVIMVDLRIRYGMRLSYSLK